MGFRAAAAFLITHYQPLWSRSFRLGRRHVTNQLGRDELQCFRSAQLLDAPPEKDVIVWWDGIAQRFYSTRNEELLAQGRRAEELSFAHECQRVSLLGFAQKPQWIAIEDNTIGYDILSYDLVAGMPRSKMIEVKSSTANPPVIVLSRNEWDTALRLKETYFFHLWDLKNEKKYERSVEDIRVHIPADQGIGKWKTVEIPLKELRSENNSP